MSTPPAPGRTTPCPRVCLVAEQLWQPVPGGSGTYIIELAQALHSQGVPLRGLAARHPAHPSPVELGMPPVPVHQARFPRHVLYEAWNRMERPCAEAIAPGSDLVHATTWAVPGTRLPLVVTVHDLAFLRSPEHFTRRGNAYFLKSLARTRAQATAVIVPSRATAADCLDAGIEHRRLFVIPHGVRTAAVSAAASAEFRARHRLTNPYILWTGTREPRKNLSTLLRAYGCLAPDCPDIDLVLVGPQGWGDHGEEKALADALPGRIHVLGRLSTNDLAAAYAGSRAFAFPSHWEGFGLPVLEAMAYGSPVVTSRGTSMEEIVDDAGLLVDPSDPGELAGALRTAVGQAHDELVEAGRARASTFTWEACAQAHRAVYRAALR